MPLHLKGVEKQSMTSDVNKYHIVPLWTGFYFSDTWGCQAAAVHRSGDLRSLPWSLWLEFLRRQWKKKIVKSDLLLSLGRKRTWIFACRARKAAPLEGFGLAAEKSPCGPPVWWLWLPRDIAEGQTAARSCENTWITRLPWSMQIVHLAFKNVLLRFCKTPEFSPGKSTLLYVFGC